MNQYLANKSKSIDALIVLGGQQDHCRTNLATQVWHHINHLRGKKVPIIVSGYSWVLAKQTPQESEAQVMRNNLVEKEVNNDFIMLEERSLDIIQNLVYSQLNLEVIRAQINPNLEHIGLITNDFHMPRALTYANKIISNDFNIIPIEVRDYAGISKGFMGSLKEKITMKCMDTYMYQGPRRGQTDKWVQYIKQTSPAQIPREHLRMHEKYPFYWMDAPEGRYKSLIKVATRL